MQKAQTALQKSLRALGRYKFDTSKYIIVEAGVRRDRATGQLVVHSSSKDVKVSKTK